VNAFKVFKKWNEAKASWVMVIGNAGRKDPIDKTFGGSRQYIPPYWKYEQEVICRLEALLIVDNLWIDSSVLHESVEVFCSHSGVKTIFIKVDQIDLMTGSLKPFSN
jgi:hypothetical protein